MSDPPSGPPSPSGSIWASLAARRNEQVSEILDQRKRAEESRAAIAETTRRGFLLANGTAQEPLTSALFDRQLSASNEKIAEWLSDFAAAFGVTFGLAFVDEPYPMPHHGLGHEAGRALWDMAIRQVPRADLATSIAEARTALGPYDSVRTIGSREDTEAGLIDVFEHLGRLPDRVTAHINVQVWRQANGVPLGDDAGPATRAVLSSISKKPGPPAQERVVAPSKAATAPSPAPAEAHMPVPATDPPAGEVLVVDEENQTVIWRGKLHELKSKPRTLLFLTLFESGADYLSGPSLANRCHHSDAFQLVKGIKKRFPELAKLIDSSVAGYRIRAGVRVQRAVR